MVRYFNINKFAAVIFKKLAAGKNDGKSFNFGSIMVDGAYAETTHQKIYTSRILEDGTEVEVFADAASPTEQGVFFRGVVVRVSNPNFDKNEAEQLGEDMLVAELGRSDEDYLRPKRRRF